MDNQKSESLQSDDENIASEIEGKFETFKNQYKPKLDNVEIFVNSYTPMEFYITNGEHQCMAGTILLEPDEKVIDIDDIRHCGGNNISLLLSFIRTLSHAYKAPITIVDSSKFDFENNVTNENVSIELKKLYLLSEGRTYYDKYLYPNKTHRYHIIPITFFQEHRDKFTSEYSKIMNMLGESRTRRRRRNKRTRIKRRKNRILTIGDFFMKIRELLKSISHNENGVKMVDNYNWNDLLLYKHIIDKTYNIIKNPRFS